MKTKINFVQKYLTLTPVRKSGLYHDFTVKFKLSMGTPLSQSKEDSDQREFCSIFSIVLCINKVSLAFRKGKVLQRRGSFYTIV